ncbi:uncharacterized protein [Lepeophtheirus salmonis]|uniref:uncharacterized protein n=1 Tax=Lepeophtheirus salmonis TaxID=72036 RepID=UPI003AF3D843
MERICQFHIRGRCNRSNCEFKHSSLPNSGNSVPKANANRPCKFFESSGFCRMGENCRFLHEKSLNLPKRRPMLDSDEEILKGPDSDDDDSVVSGFTEHMAVLAREPEFDFSDREEDYESGGALKESQPLHNPDANINKEHDPFKDKCNNSGETITLGDDSSTILKENTCVEDQKTTSTLSKSTHDQSPYVEKEISVEDHNEKDQVCRSSSTEDHSIRQESHSDKIVPQDPNDDKEAEDELLILSPEKNETKEIYTPVSSSKSKTKPKKTLPNHNLPLPKFDPDKFKPGYIPPIIKDGDAEYAVVVTGVKDTGLCGKYWGDMNNLSSRRKSRVSHVQDQSSPITNSIKKTMKRTSSRSYSKNAKMHEEDDNKKSLNDTRLSPKNTQITSINSKEYHIFNSSSNGTKYQSSDNLTQESTCDADDLPSKSSIELKNSSNQSQKSITNKKSKSLSPKKEKKK